MTDTKTPPADPKETAVAVKGLAPSVDDAALTMMCGAHGKLLRVKRDGLGGAHVVFASTRAAQRAAAALSGAVVHGQKISAQHVRTFAKTTRPCRGFQEGKCRKGDQCKYWHPTDGATATPTVVPTVATKSKTPTQKVNSSVADVGDDISGIPKASICRNFAKGKCQNGEQCRFAHVLGAGELPPPVPGSIPAPCSFFAAGRCTKGDDCAFLHTDRPLQPPASKQTTCSFYAAGRCARGDQCAYIHEAKPESTATAPAATQPTAKAKPTKAAPVKKTKPTIPASVDDRTCIECEKPGVASWVCAGCDNTKYCDECKTMVHRPKVMRSHSQEPLPVVAPRPVCGECEAQPASVQCQDCGVSYCATCDASVHQFKSLRNHSRARLEGVNPVSMTDKPAKKSKPETPAPMTYIDSVPQYDLPSDSESSDDDNNDEEDGPQATQRNNIQQRAVQEASSDNSDSDDESPAAAAMKAVTKGWTSSIQSVPKYDLSSESESSSDEDEQATTADDDDSVEEVKQSIVKAAVVAVKQKIMAPVRTTPVDSSESDDDDFEDERPIVNTPASAPTKPALPTSAISSESESESDDEYVQHKAKITPTPAPKRKLSTSSASSDSDSSDNDAPPPKQQSIAPKAPVAPVARTRPNQDKKVGISTGSTHTLVKTIEAYAESDNSEVLHLDPNLNGFERLLAHDCAERLGLHHVSVGEGLERHITISRGTKRAGATANGTGKKQKRV